MTNPREHNTKYLVFEAELKKNSCSSIVVFNYTKRYDGATKSVDIRAHIYKQLELQTDVWDYSGNVSLNLNISVVI